MCSGAGFFSVFLWFPPGHQIYVLTTRSWLQSEDNESKSRLDFCGLLVLTHTSNRWISEGPHHVQRSRGPLSLSLLVPVLTSLFGS